jgi:uncharacterized protein YlxW (UPF0749 family)
VTISERLRAIPSWQLTLGAALLGLGFLVAAQLASEAPRVRYTTQERSPLIETALGLQGQQEELKARILELREEIGYLELAGQGSAVLVRELNRQLEEARISAGLIPLVGTGIVFQLEDSLQPAGPGANEIDYLVGARDIRTMVEELWLAGAEALAVNGERVTNSTAIIDIGGTLLVNSAYLAPPYRISAIGPPEIYARLSGSEGFIDFFRARADAYGLRITYAEPEQVDMPAFAGTVTLRYSRPVMTPAPSGTP